MEDIKQEQFWDFVKEEIEENVLAPLTIIYTYRQYKIFNKFFRDDEDYDIKVNRICNILRKGFDGHSFFATDIRFVVLYFVLLQGRLHVPSHILEIICEYPHIEHEDERMRLGCSRKWKQLAAFFQPLVVSAVILLFEVFMVQSVQFCPEIPVELLQRKVAVFF